MSGLGAWGCNDEIVDLSGLSPSYALQMHCPENSKQIFPEKKLRGLISNSTFMYLWAIYIFPQSVRKRNRRTDHRNIAHRYMNVEIGNEDAQFRFREYMFRLFVTVWAMLTNTEFIVGWCMSIIILPTRKGHSGKNVQFKVNCVAGWMKALYNCWWGWNTGTLNSCLSWEHWAPKQLSSPCSFSQVYYSTQIVEKRQSGLSTFSNVATAIRTL